MYVAKKIAEKIIIFCACFIDMKYETSPRVLLVRDKWKGVKAYNKVNVSSGLS